ncbi:MAG: PIN domain-containing protein [Candidatus Thermoplasmatota archaeon]
MTWAADTSWLYGLFDRQDEFHARARDEATDPGVVVVNPMILAEYLDVVRTKRGRQASLDAHKALALYPQLRFVEPPKQPAMVRIMERFSSISWHDASAIATALDEGAGLRTFDKDQRKAFEALR